MYTLNQIVRKIKEIATDHIQLRTVHGGSILHYLEKKSDVLFPLMTIDVESSYIQSSREYFVLQLAFVDLLNIDNGEHLIEIHSDMLSASRDIEAALKKSVYQWRVEDGARREFLTPVSLVSTPDVTAGLVTTITLSQIYDPSKCSAAFFNEFKIFDKQFDDTFE